jgi:alpha-1,2-mannosyltransferase
LRVRHRIAVVVGLAVAALIFDAAFATRHGFFDLKVYYGAINWWVHGDGELYDFIKPRSTYGFTYPPFAAVAMLPMALVPWGVAIVIASTMTVVATALVVWWLVAEPDRRYKTALVMALLIAYEPTRETFLFGQVNMLLVALVAGDLFFGAGRNRRWAGLGIGLATAVKLTPGLFIFYLLITKRWRAAFVAICTAAGATLLTAAVAPDMAREFFTSALWNTGRVGSLAFISNQSLQGLVARLNPGHPPTLLWAVLALGVLIVWVVRSRRAFAAGDEAAGLAVTGIVSCLISPVTWIHHLVWLIPALILLVNAGLADKDHRWRYWGVAGVSYAILCSKLVWPFHNHFSGLWGFLGSNAYVFITLVLLFVTPIRSPHDVVAQLGVAEGGAARGPQLANPVGP